MPAYGALSGQMRNQKKKLQHIVIHMPSAETEHKHVIEHHFGEAHKSEMYAFQKEEGPEMMRHLQQSIGMHDLNQARGSDQENRDIDSRGGEAGYVGGASHR